MNLTFTAYKPGEAKKEHQDIKTKDNHVHYKCFPNDFGMWTDYLNRLIPDQDVVAVRPTIFKR